MSDRVRKVWDSPWRQRAQSAAHPAAMWLSALLGVFLRVNGWLGRHNSFWMDEALWASRLLHRDLLALNIRPVGFMGFTRWLVGVFGATEVWFRFLPAVGGVAAVLLMPYVASRLVKPWWLQVLMVLLFAIQPALIDYANEFKPYSWEVFVHLVPVAMYLRYRETQRARWFYAILAYLPIGFLFAYNLALAFPGLLLLCLGLAWHSAERRRRVAAVLVSAAFCATACGAIFKLALTKTTREDRTEDYWGKKYDVFYERTEPQSRVDWTIQKYNDMAAFVGQRRDFWAGSERISEKKAMELATVERGFWIASFLAGVWAMRRSQRDLLLVLWLPTVVVVAANVLGKWPLGAFRTNLWVMTYTVPIPFLGLELIAATRRAAALGVGALAMALTVVPAFAFGFDWDGHKRTFTRDFYQREVIEKLYQYRRQQLAKNPDLKRAPLLVDPHTWYPQVFYMEDQPVFRARYADFFARNFDLEKVGQGTINGKLAQRLRGKRPGEGLWVVSSSRRDFDDMRRSVPRTVKVVIEEQVADQHVIMYVERKTE